MKFDIRFLTILMVIFLFSISFASAANQTVDKTFNDFQVEINNAKPGDTINLESDYSYADGFEENGILIDKTVSINGNGLTFDGKNTARIFNITADNVTINNARFVNGYKEYINETVEDSAGAIFCSGSNLIINNCTFLNNYAGCNGGGAIAIHGNGSTLTNNYFYNNTALNSGGAVKINGSDNLISDNVFESNYALTKHGGAAYIIANNTQILNNVFTGNVAQYSGGGFRIQGFYLTVKDNLFTYNNATEFLGGGACVLGDDNLVCDNLFKYNFAGRDGGGLDFEGDIVDTDGLRITCQNNTFIENYVNQYGGGMTMNCQYGLVTNNTFLRNYAGMIGAAFRVNGAFEDTGNFTRNIIVNNTAGVSGGGIFIRGNGTIISENLFYNNTALSVAGGAITFHGNNSKISNNEIKSNKANMSGGGVYCDGEYVIFENNNIVDCHAGTTGGALYFIEKNGIIRNNKFINNTAGTLAGATHIKSNNAIISNNEYTNNVAGSSGGAAYTEGKYITITSNSFTSNKAGSKSVGGAIRHIGNKAVITDNKFDNNYAGEGLSIYGHGNNETITKNSFTSYDEKNEVVWNYLRPVTVLTIPTTTFVFSEKNKSFSAILNDEDGNILSGKTIYFTVKGKTYTAKTDANGKAAIQLSLSKIKKYKVYVEYKGDSLYKPVNKTVKVKITKEKTKITAPKKTFKSYVTNKKVTVKLKSASKKALKNKKITLKVNGKKYKATTNKKGKATFNVKLTKKSTYVYKVTFKEDSKYLSATKEGKIYIK